MAFSKWRDYAFLSQASYRDLTSVLRGADPTALERALTDNAAGVLNPANRFADFQAKQLSGSASGNDPTDGYTFLGLKGPASNCFHPQ